MKCKYFGLCGSCNLYNMSYQEQLEYKREITINRFKIFGIEKIDIIPSPPIHFRFRAEFRIFQIDREINYQMSGFNRERILIDECFIVEKGIYNLMPILKREIEKSNLLKFKLFAVEFLTSNLKEIIVTLIYHKKIDNEWLLEAKELAKKLNISIIGRSRGVKLLTDRDFINEKLSIKEREFFYQIGENSFTQPNSYVNQKMVSWVIDNLDKNRNDLLELYCGHGNFTIPLSFYFDKVLATEISKTSIKLAKINSKLNKIDNISFIRLSSKEMSEAINRERIFKRLKEINLDDYIFSHIFVDPPRAGLDEESLKLVQKFDNIIYISCNQESLLRDLKELKEYQIVKFALFDQFAYTKHIETGVILKKIV